MLPTQITVIFFLNNVLSQIVYVTYTCGTYTEVLSIYSELPLEKNTLLSLKISHLSIAPQLKVGFINSFPLYARMFTSLTLCNSCEVNHRFYEFMGTGV